MEKPRCTLSLLVCSACMEGEIIDRRAEQPQIAQWIARSRGDASSEWERKRRRRTYSEACRLFPSVLEIVAPHNPPYGQLNPRRG